jgi:uncharacterized Zn-binding protein involved in type VI secretion
MRGVIRLNDPTSHGGRVASASTNHRVLGLGVARVGDRCSCPRKGHGGCFIAEGDPAVRIEGRPVAFDGHRTSCGAVLRSTAPRHGRP